MEPPASGDTMIQLIQSGMCSFIHFITAGSAYKLSKGMSTKPWICEACKSIVIMWSAPATDKMLATNLAVMGALLYNRKTINTNDLNII